MFIIAVGNQDAPLRVMLTENPQVELEAMQRRRADVVRLYHKARVAEPVAATTLEYVHVLLADWKIQRKPDWFQVAPDDAKTIIERAIAACAVVDKPPPDMTRVKVEMPIKAARPVQALAEMEGVEMKALIIEAVNLLYASRNLPAPLKEKS